MRLHLLSICIIGLVLAADSSAATFTWDGGGADNNFNTAANWVGDAAPPNDGTADIVFAGAVRLTPTMNVAYAVRSVSFAAGSGAFAVGGASALTINNGAINSQVATGTITISAPIIFNTVAPTITSAAGGTLTLSGTVNTGGLLITVATAGTSNFTGVVSGAGGVLKTGAGTHTQTAANTYTGATTIQAGVLAITAGGLGGVASPLGQSSNAAANLVLDGGTLRYTGTATATTDRLFTLTANGGALDSSSATAASIFTFSNAGAIVASGSGDRTLTLTGTNLSGSTNGEWSNNTSTLTCSIVNPATGVTSVVKTGVGVYAVAGTASTYTGPTTVTSGQLAVRTSAGLGGSAASVAAGAQLAFANHGLTIANNITLNGLTTNMTMGTVTVTGALGGDTIGGAGNNTLTGTLTLAATSNVSTSWSDKSVTLSGPITGPGGLQFDLYRTGNQPPLIFMSNATSNYAGTTTVAGGTVIRLQADNVLSTNTVILNAGRISSSTTAARTLTNALQFTGNFTLGDGNATLNGALTFPSAVTLNANTTMTVDSPVAFGAGIAETGGVRTLAKAGAGVLSVAGASTYTGATTISAGTLRLRGDTGTLLTPSVAVTSGSLEIDATAGGNPDRIPDASTVTLNAGGTLVLSAPADETRTEAIGTLTLNDQSQVAVNANSNTAGQGDARVTAASITTAGAQVLMRTNTGSVGTEYGNLLSAVNTVNGVGAGSITVYEQSGASGRIAPGLYDVTEGVIASGTTSTTIYTSVASGNWDNTATWTPTPPTGGPTAADTVIIANNHNVSLNGANRAANAVIFNALVAGNAQISGANTLAIGSGGITVNATNNPAPTISSNVDLGGAALSITVNSTNATALTISGAISNGSLVKLGNGYLTLTGNNNFTGGVVHSGGFITAGSSTALGTVAGTLRMNLNAKRLLLANGVNVANPIIMDAATPDVGRGVFEGPGTGSATLSGAMALNVGPTNGAHFYGGTGLVLAGFITSPVVIGQRDLVVTYSGGGSYPGLLITGTANIGVADGICPTAVVTLGASAGATLNLNNFNQTFGGLVLGASGAGVVNTGTGTLTLNGDVASSGNFAHVLNGNLNLGGATRTFNIADSTVAVDLNVAAIVANGGVLKNGAGNMQFTAVNSYAGPTTVDFGTLTLQGNTATIALSSALTINAGVVDINNTVTGNPNRIGDTTAVTIGNGGVLQMTAPANELRSETIGALALNNGSQVMVVATSNTAGQGDARLTASSITVTGSAMLTRRAAGTVTTELGNLLSGAGSIAGAGTINVLEFSSASGQSGPGVYNATEGVVVGGTTVSTYISAATGNWDVPATWIPASPAGGPVATDNVIIASNHNVSLNGADRAAASVTFQGAGTISGAANTLTVGAGGITVEAAGNPAATISSLLNLGGVAKTILVKGGSTLTLSNVISNGGIVKTGPGLLALTSATASTYAGNTVVNEGVLSFANDNQLGAVPAAAAPGNIVVNGGATLRAALAASQTLSANRGVAVGPTTGSGNATIEVTANTLTYNGILANNGGNGGFIKIGGGVLSFAGTVANTYSGPTVINAGAILFTNDNQLGAVPAAVTPGNIVINNAVLRTGSNVTLSTNRGVAIGPVTGTGPGSFDITANTLIYDGVIANNGGVGALIKTSGGTLQLGGNNTFGGSVTVTGGTLSVNNDNNFGTGNRIDIDNSAQLTTRATMTIATGRAVGIGPATGAGRALLNIGTGFTLTYNGVIDDRGTGVASIYKLGAGTLQLGGSNLFGGMIEVEAGNLTVTNVNALGDPASGNGVRVVANNTLEFNLNGVVPKPVEISGTLRALGNVTLPSVGLLGNTTINVVNAADVLTINGNIDHLVSSNLTFTGSGNATVNGVITTPQAPVVSNLVGRYFNPITDYFIGTAAGINNVSFTAVPTNTVTLNTARLSYPDDATLIAAFGAQPNNNQFTLVLLGDLVVPTTGIYYASSFLNDDENVVWIDLNRNGTFETGEMIVRAGAFNDFYSVGGATLTAGLTYKFAAACRDTGGGGAIVSRLEKGAVGQPPLSRNLVIVNEVAPGTNSLAKTGTGMVTLAGNNTFTGNVTVQNGVLSLTHTNALGATNKTVQITGDAATSLLPEVRLSGGINPVVTTLIVSGNGVTGAGVIRNVSGVNSISATTITMTSGNGGTTFGSDSGTLTVNGPLSANVTARTLTLTGASSGVLTGSIADGTTVGLPLTKAGAGTWTLTGASTYTGATTVSTGTLIAANTTGSATGTGVTTVAAGATLAGTGTLSGNVVVNGTVAPGIGGIGTLNFGSAATFNAGSSFAVELNGATNDRLVVGGTVTLTNPALNLTAAGTAHPQAYTVLERTPTGAITGTFNGIVNGGTIVSGRTFVVRYDLGTDSNDVLLIDDTPPAFTAATTNTTQNVDENTPLTALAATDVDGDGLTYTVISGSLPSGVTALNANGTFAGIPDYTSAGTYNLVIQVSDGFGGFANTNLAITVNDFGFSISDVTVNENAGTATLVVTRTGTGTQAATLDVATQNGTALAGADYTAFNTTLSWAIGDTTPRNVVITILNDALSEGSETFNAVLSNASVGGINKAIGVVTITDDEPLPTLAISGVTVAESAGVATLTVAITGTSANVVSVDYVTVNGTAVGGQDFTASTGTVTWAALDTAPKTFTVAITDDVIFDPGESFTVNLQNVSASAQIATGTATVQITDNDVPPAAVNDTATVGQNSPRAINVLANDTGLTNLPLTVTIVTAPANGTATVNADNSVTFSPALNFTGADSFVYRVTDSAGQVSQATVSVTVKPPPVITSQPVVTPNPAVVGTPVLGSVAADVGTITWAWGDGTSGTGSSVTHGYAAAGNYTVVVTVTSDEGLTTTATLSVLVGFSLDGGSNGVPGGGATPPGVTGILIGGAGAGKAQGGTGKITCNYVRREKTMYQGSIGSLALPATMTQDQLAMQVGTLVIGTGANAATFRFDVDKRGKGRATGLPLVEFNVKKKRFKFKAMRADLTDLTEALGGPREFTPKDAQPVTLLVPVTLQIGDKVFLAMTFQVKYKQINNGGRGGL